MDSELLVELGQFKHDRAAETSAHVGRTGSDVPKVMMVSIPVPSLLERRFDGINGTGPTSKHLLHVASILR
jgi:hypothetical protein